jgi:hypothetical protein
MPKLNSNDFESRTNQLCKLFVSDACLVCMSIGLPIPSRNEENTSVSPATMLNPVQRLPRFNGSKLSGWDWWGVAAEYAL